MSDDAPDRGDVVWLDLDLRVGREQSGYRPVLILTPRAFNARRGIAIGCPMTSRIRGHFFEVVVSREPPSDVLADQVRAIDLRARRARFRSRVDPVFVDDVAAKVATLIGA